MKNKFEKIKIFSKRMRKAILETSFKCGEPSHIGGALSIVDIMAVLYGDILDINIKRPRDRFILSKGHGFLALLSALHCANFIKKEQLETFQSNGSDFIAHPIMNEKLGIESSNGSLGQGLSYGIGISIAYKKISKKGSIYVVLGDGECYEGAVWEAAISATESNLTNLTVIVDCNGFQNDGNIGPKMSLKDIKKKWEGFGWKTLVCDGHNLKDIYKCLCSKKTNQPTAIIAKTIKGKGVKFMENNNDWHHGRLTKNLYEQAVKNL